MSRRHSKYTTIPIDHETKNKYHAYSYKETSIEMSDAYLVKTTRYAFSHKALYTHLTLISS
jgi:hypothetical protein